MLVINCYCLAEKAVLLYKKNDNILDIQSVNVPIQYQRQGIGRLLAEVKIKIKIYYIISMN